MKKYISKIKNLTVVIDPARSVFENGQKVGSFIGKRARFEEGRYQTDDKEIIEKLDSLPSFGVDYWVDDGETPESVSDAGNENNGNENDLESKTKTELFQMAKDKGLRVDSKTNKQKLIKLLKGENV